MLGTSVTHMIGQALASVQLEITILVFAACAHMVLFGRFGIRSVLPTLKKSLPNDDDDASGTFDVTPRLMGITALPSNALDGVKHALRSSNLQSAIEHLQKIPGGNPPQQVASALLRLCAKESPEGAANNVILELYEQHLFVVDFSGDTEVERLVVDAALRAGRTDLLTRLMSVSTGNVGQVALLKALGSEHRLTDAMIVFQACPEKTSCLYNALLDSCIECRDMRNAEKVMSQANAAGLADVVTYNTMLKAHLQTGNHLRGRAVIKSMRCAGLQPNVVTFNELIDATIQTDIDGAWELIAEMKTCRLKPNHITCSILLKSLQPGSRPVDVERTMAVMATIDDEMDEVLLSSAFEAYIRIGWRKLLVMQLKRFQQNKRIQVKGAATYGSIIRAYGFVQDLNGVWETWRAMRLRDIVPTSITLGCMVEAVITNGDPDAGYQLIREIVDDPRTRSLVNAVTYCSVIKGFCHQRRFDRVWSVYQEMVAEKLEFSIVTYNSLVNACARCGEMDRALPLLEEMAQNGIEPNVITYSTVLKGYCQWNHLDKAFELLKNMKRTLQFKPDEVTYNSLLDGCARQGFYDRGVALLQEMQDAGVQPTNFTLSVLVKLANRSKRFAEAFEFCEDLSKKYGLRLNVHVYNNLVQTCVDHKDFKRAFAVFEQMLDENVHPDNRTYMLLLRGSINACDAHGAAGILRSAVGLDNGHPRLARFNASLVQPHGGLPSELIAEVVESIARRCREQKLAENLLCDLRSVSGVKVDPRLSMRLFTKAIHRAEDH